LLFVAVGGKIFPGGCTYGRESPSWRRILGLDSMTNELVFLTIGILVGGMLGWFMGAQSGMKRVQGQVAALLRAVRSRDVPDAQQSFPGEIPMLRELRTLLARGWAPKTRSGEGPSQAVLERLAHYLKVRVEDPLLDGLDKDPLALREGVESVVDAVEDVRFFLQDPPEGRPAETHNLVDLVGEVTREFSGQFTIRVQVDAPPEPLRVQVDAEPLKDALFLILHNAGEFGGGDSVDMTLVRKEEGVRILIRDRGPGFSAEALSRAFDPFYSTTSEGLGLGLPYARKAVRAQGGELILRNPEDGGGEVEIVLPQSG
jgi:signal transduction histidine kinase